MKLLERLARTAARRRLAKATVECYSAWVTDFLRFCRVDGRWRTPAETGAADVQAFLTSLAADRKLSASSQNQACNAIAFLFNQVLVDELGKDHLGRSGRNGRSGRSACRPYSAPLKSRG